MTRLAGERSRIAKGLIVDVPNTTSFLILPKKSATEKYTNSRATKEAVQNVLKPSKFSLKVKRIAGTRRNGRVEALDSDLDGLRNSPKTVGCWTGSPPGG